MRYSNPRQTNLKIKKLIFSQECWGEGIAFKTTALSNDNSLDNMMCMCMEKEKLICHNAFCWALLQRKGSGEWGKTERGLTFFQAITI